MLNHASRAQAAPPAYPSAAGNVATCDEASLLTALSGGGLVTFSCSGVIALPTTAITGIVLSADTTINASGQNVTISGSNARRIFTTTAGVALTLIDVTLADGNASGDGGAAFVNGSLTLSGANFLSNTAVLTGGAVYATGVVSANGGLLRNNQCTQNDCVGGGLYTPNVMTISGTQFISNAAQFRGGGAYVAGNVNATLALFQQNTTNLTSIGSFGGGLYSNAALTLTDTQFLSNTGYFVAGAYAETGAVLNRGLYQNNVCFASNCFGGGINSHGYLTLTDTQFISNVAPGRGGGADAFGATTLYGGSFISNTTSGFGGGMYGDGLVTISGTQFMSNVSSFGGGGVLAFGAATIEGGLFSNNNSTRGAAILANQVLVVSGTQFLNNTTSNHGGAVFASGTVILSNTQFLSNTAGVNGGGVYAEATLSVNGGLFQNNRCADVACVGGGLYVSDTLTLNGAQFISNQAVSAGGGLYANSALNLTGTQFLRNRANRGGGLYHNAGNGRVVNALFAGNTAANTTGAAQYLNSPGNVQILHTTIASPTVTGDSAIYVATGTVGVTNTIVASHSIGISNVGGIVSEDYNLFFGNGANTAGLITSGAHHPTGNPAFVAPATDDYHLSAGSPAIDAGVNAGVAIDFDDQTRPQGSAFDIGFDEVANTNVVDVAISKSVTPTSVNPGQAITYTLIFTNNGTQLATGVMISDLVPAQVTNVAYTNSGATLTPSVGVTYSWAVTNLTPGSGGRITITAIVSPNLTTATTFTNTASITSSADVTPSNNSSAAALSVVIQPISSLSATNNSPTPLGNATAFTATATGGTPPITYVWNFGDGTATASGVTQTHTYTALGVFTATVTATNGVGSITATTRVTITTAPISGLSATNNSPTVLGNITTFTASVTGGTPPITYTWNFGDGTATANGITQAHTYATLGAFTATVTATNSAGNVTATTRVTITVFPITSLTATNDSPTVVGNTTAFTATATGGTPPITYVWNFGDGSATASGVTQTHSYATVGVFTATVTATNDAGSIAATTSVTITDVPIVGLTAMNSGPTLLGSATVFTASSALGTNIVYTWDFGDGTATATGITQTHVYATVGSFTAIVTATNGQGSVSATTLVTITNLAPVANAGPDQTVNVSATATLSGANSYDPNNNLPLSYRWTQTGGAPVVLSNSALSVTTFTAPGAPAVLTFTLAVTDSGGAPSLTDAVVVSVTDVAISGLQIQGSLTATVGVPATFIVTQTSGTNVTYVWMVNGAPVPSGNPLTYTFSTPGVYGVTVTATNGAGSVTTQFTVMVQAALKKVYLPLVIQ